MWQRVQTLYIAVATALVAAMFFSLKAVIPGPDGEFAREFTYTSYVPYLILLIVISLLNLLALTTWRFRIFQMRTAVLSAIITFALQAWLAVDYFTADECLVFRFTAVFPIIAVIFDLLAAKNILADEMMVRSASRLRSAKKK